MALRKIRLGDDPLLRKISKPVKEINKNINDLLDDMIETMYKNNGVGLAAPQIGILKRIVVIDIGDGLIELINPEIIEEKGCKIKLEACLSFPDKSGLVKRPEYVKVRALDRDGIEHIYEGKDFLAVAFCHELDHLNGILYIDKIEKKD